MNGKGLAANHQLIIWHQEKASMENAKIRIKYPVTHYVLLT